MQIRRQPLQDPPSIHKKAICVPVLLPMPMEWYKCGVMRGVMVSTSAFLTSACHQWYSVGSRRLPPMVQCRFQFFFFFFFPFPSYISGVHHFWVRFLRMWPFFNPTIKVVTFRLRGWCVLGVFFVAGIHPSRTWTSGSFESVRWNALCA